MDGEVLSEEVTSELDLEDEKGQPCKELGGEHPDPGADGECMFPDIGMR